jgi:asparagine synthase (glutamine-hydrolysing)
MCGIAGVVTGTDEIPSATLLRRMADIMEHRGPDDSGVFVTAGVGLAHRRLSVIDVSKMGHQPMSNGDESVWITYNGEIYNFKQLTTQLKNLGYSFRSNTDTEAVIHAYEEFGLQSPLKLDGMFSFAIWDSKRKRFFAARDRLGIKPFYYYFDGEQLVFGSEIKAILCHPNVQRRPNTESIRQYLLLSHPIGDETWFEGIRQLPPGCALTLEHGILEIASYWEPRFNIDFDRSFESFREELRATLQTAVRDHLQSDVPVGAYLSGGIDSSSIVGLASRLQAEPVRTFSAAFDEGPRFDERAHIRTASNAFNTLHLEVVPTPRDLRRLLPKLIWHLDEPVVGPAVLPMYCVAKLVKSSGITVVNGGQGADELFGGYPPFFVAAARNLLSRGALGHHATLAELARVPQYLLKGGAISRTLGRVRFPDASVPWIIGGNGERAELQDIWRASADKSLVAGSFEEMSYESRVPFLDHRVVQLAMEIPSWYKVRTGTLKCILRESMRSLVPDSILDRRDKLGYPTPSGRWFAGRLSGYLKETLTQEKMYARDIVDSRVVAQMIEEHSSGTRSHGDRLWKILNLELWMRTVLSQPPQFGQSLS